MAAIKGTVKVVDAPVGGAYVRLHGPSGEFVSEQYTKDDGNFTFHVVNGTWTLEARAAGTNAHTETVEISDDRDAALDVTLATSS